MMLKSRHATDVTNVDSFKVINVFLQCYFHTHKAQISQHFSETHHKIMWMQLNELPKSQVKYIILTSTALTELWIDAIKRFQLLI